MNLPPATQFAQADDVNIGYQVIGDGPIDLIWISGFRSNMEVMWEEPALAALFRRLSDFSRLVLFDRRGSGVSDRGGTTATPTLEERMEDVAAVLNAVGSKRAALFGFSEGGTVAALFAAAYPERTSSVIVYGTPARFIRDDEHPWGWYTEENYEDFIEMVENGWGLQSAASEAAEVWAPSLVGDKQFTDWFAKFARQSLSRRDVAPFLWSLAEYDLVDVFPTVHVPCLVLHRKGDRLIPVSHGRRIAKQIPDARFVELPGDSHLPWVGDAERVAHEIEDFVAGSRDTESRDRRLLTVVVTDIAETPPPTTNLGDRASVELLSAHDREVDHQVVSFGGQSIKRLGTRCLAVFDGPARAIRCALSIVDAAARLGVKVGVGVHCGECEIVDEDIRGIAVNVGVRIAELARPGEVLVSASVRDLVAGSGIRFGTGREAAHDGHKRRRTVFPVLVTGTTPDDVRRLTVDQANLLRCDGEYWTVAYAGQVAVLRDRKGLWDLARLLDAPDGEIHVLDLISDTATEVETLSGREAAEAGLHANTIVGEPVIDAKARAAYQRRLAELEEELNDARARRDQGTAERAGLERDALIRELSAAYGLGGRPRRTSDEVERARKTVYRRIRTALDRIKDAHPVLGRHLDASVHTGVYCSYQPERSPAWRIEIPSDVPRQAGSST